MSAIDVAKESVEGFLRGDAIVVPGLINQVFLWSSSWLPPKIMRLITEVAWR